MTKEPPETAVVDANVLLNFAALDRLDLLQNLSSLDFVVPEEVWSEIRRPVQRSRVRSALEEGALRLVRLDDAGALSIFGELRELMDLGESACLALAEHYRWIVVSDEKRRFRSEARRRLGKRRILNTAGLVLLTIRQELLTVEEADTMKDEWERHHRFRLKFESFRDVVGRRV